MEVALRYTLFTLFSLFALFTLFINTANSANSINTVYTDPKTVMGSEFDQETAEKIAHKSIARPDLANCMSISLVLNQSREID